MTQDLGSGAERCGGSSPPSRTMTTLGIARARGQAPQFVCIFVCIQNRFIHTTSWKFRFAAYQAVEKLPDLSGRTMATLDEYFFFSRKRCPEMSEPDCSSCSADPVCAHRKELFQPVFRTDYY